MTVLVPLALFGWLPLVLLLFLWLPVRRSVTVAFFAGWLFLPSTGYPLPGLPDYNKMFVVCGSLVIGVILFDFRRVRAFRFRWYDLPMIVWCLCPFVSSVQNQLSAYDGVSWVWTQTVTWGFPYFLGRLYYADEEGLRELAFGVFLSGVVYIPFCLFEIRMSPQLSQTVYGFSPRSWAGTRLGGWRPMVFLEHGLALGMWMTTSSLVGYWLWSSGTIKKWGDRRWLWALPVLLATTVLCRSTAALGLLMGGLACLYASRWLWTSLPVMALIALPPVYYSVRATAYWDGSEAVSLARSLIGPDRAQSLGYRFSNENILADKALERPVFGWGRWGRSRVLDERGRDISVTDGRWIITFGQNGLVGLISLTAAFLWPAFWFCRTFRPKSWSYPEVAPAAALVVAVMLASVDNLLNAMPNPVPSLAIGALSGFLASVRSGPQTQETDRQRRLWPPTA